MSVNDAVSLSILMGSGLVALISALRIYDIKQGVGKC